MKHLSLLGCGLLAVTLLFLATVWGLPAMASPAPGASTPSSPTPLPTPDLDVKPGQILNVWFMLIAGGVFLALLAFGGGLLSMQIQNRTVDRQDRRED